MGELNKKSIEISLESSYLEYQIENNLQTDFEACKEIADHSKQLEALENILKAYWKNIVEWGKLNDLKFVANDFSFASMNMDTGKITWNEDAELDEIELIDISGNKIPFTADFENENHIHKKYQYLISLIAPVINYKDKLKRKIEIKQEYENQNQPTGFSCSLHPDTIKEIYYFMAKKFIKGDLQYFQAIFSNSLNTVTKPIQWLVLNKRGTNKGRGNQTALNEFLKFMLGKVSNSDRRKAKDLFVDEQGCFIKKSLLKPDEEKISGYGFETGIKEILKKADQ